MGINQFENPMTFVRALKGAPASVLWAFVFTRRMMTALELQQWTGFKGDNITVAIRLLVDLGWVVARAPRGPWGMADGRQLPLMFAQGELDSLTRADSDLIGVVPTTTTTREGVYSEFFENEKKKTPPRARVVVEAMRSNPILSESHYQTRGVTYDENLKACRRHNIGEPKASEIALSPWVSPQFIDAHVKSLEPGSVIGLAILRILNDEFPRLWAEEIENLPEGLSQEHQIKGEWWNQVKKSDEYLAENKKRKDAAWGREIRRKRKERRRR